METITFASDEPDSELLPPLEELADCAATVLGREGKTILSYGPGAGYTPLRELIAEWFGVHPSRVLLTAGWQQALSLLGSVLSTGRTTAIESPADERQMKRLLGLGGSLLYILGDEDGFSAADLSAQMRTGATPSLVLVAPDFSNPTGRMMSLERRVELLRLIARFNMRRGEPIMLAEDGSYELTRYEGERLPSLFELSAREAIFGSSFSATIAPGLRTGWLIVPEQLARPVAERASATYTTPPLLGQATVFEFIRRGRFEPHLIRAREKLHERRDALLAALARHFPDASWSRPQGGYFVWLELPSNLDGRALLERAEGVTAKQGLEFTVTSNFIRLSYSSVGAAAIPTGVERLAAALP